MAPETAVGLTGTDEWSVRGGVASILRKSPINKSAVLNASKQTRRNQTLIRRTVVIDSTFYQERLVLCGVDFVVIYWTTWEARCRT